MLDLLNTYLIPFALGLPLAVLLLVLTRHASGEDERPFEATLQAAPPAVERAPEPVLAPELLVIDDSAVARAKLKRLFEGAGYRVQLAVDGLEALELLGTRRFAVLVTDLEMPRMDGFELIASVQGNLETEDLPIIAITGHDELQAKVHDCKGLYGLFKKPWNDRELLKRVAALAALPQASLPLAVPAPAVRTA